MKVILKEASPPLSSSFIFFIGEVALTASTKNCGKTQSYLEVFSRNSLCAGTLYWQSGDSLFFD